MFTAMAPARRRLLNVVVLVAAAALIAVAVLVWLKARGDDVTPVSQSDAGPVLLVPGYGGATSGLEVLAKSLRESGRDAVVVDMGDLATSDLNKQAEVLDEAVQSALDDSGASSVDIVGYSAGGVVARLWVANEGGGNLARRVVTIGSPHHGTDVAGLASAITPGECPEACQQLSPDSDLLRILNAGDETPEGPRWVSIWTANDQTVVPPQSAELDGALDFSVQSVCADSTVSHSDLPSDADVIGLVTFELDAATPAVPPGSTCA